MITIDLFTEGKISLPSRPYAGISIPDIKSFAKKICLFLKLKNIILTIVICDNNYILKINKNFRKKNKPTDVIAFAYRENPLPNIKAGWEILGDIYISLEMASDNAKTYGVTLQEEMRRLIAHGILHLIGYDHEKSREDKKTMQDKENKIYHYFSSASSKLVVRKPSRVFHKSSSE